MKNRRRNLFVTLISMSIFSSCQADYVGIDDSCTEKDHFTVDDQFTNPILPRGADPWIIQKDGIYYFTYTQGGKLVLYATNKVSELALADSHDAWIPPSGTMYSKNIWAPELHFIQNKWYMYFAADDGQNANHRMYAVENDSADPLQGEWTFKGKVGDASDEWAIDGTVLDYNDQLYMLWSGGNAGAPPQRIYIAKMSDPWTIVGEKVMIAAPEYPWEMTGNPINEGPQIITAPTGQTHVVYSGSGYWVDTYCLGLLSLRPNGDPMNPDDWEKKPEPIFSMRAESGAYGPGHNGFFKSPDGTEDWFIYHARSKPSGASNNGRNARIQPFSWNADGTPHFGEPAKIGQNIQRPSGETHRLLYKKINWEIIDFSSEELVNSRLADRLIDGLPSTYWITRYSNNPTDYPDHYITVDMHNELDVDGFSVLQKEGDRKIKDIVIEVSHDGQIWEEIGEYELKNIEDVTQFVELEQRMRFRYFKLVPKSGYDDQPQPGLAEVGTFRFQD